MPAHQSKGGIIAQVTALVTAITALLAALTAMYQAWTASQQAGVASKAAASAQVDQQTPPASPSPTQGATWVVQLATYLAQNCGLAEDEVALYQKEFQPEKPRLWRLPSGTAVVVGIPAQTEQRAKDLRDQARRLASIPQYQNESLNQARVRANPGWTPLDSCKALKA
jgi:hypothetical protein